MSASVLIRVANALREMSDTPQGCAQPAPEQGIGWLQRGDGTWSPVYADGLVGPEFTWAQMIAARGEDLGDVLDAVVEAGLIGGPDHQGG
ncbi:hypothetical protein [Nocardia sp. CNY236]|uniref:hypothetical protein n=1 Tax=Nocardia sp. CNY236 TaxID=1169152 RepID=UPI00048A8D10|nr:hypothetical protein [Nocardia sp. CNY236]